MVHDRDSGVSRLHVVGDHLTLPEHLTLKRRVLVAALKLRTIARTVRLRVSVALLVLAIFSHTRPRPPPPRSSTLV